MTHEELLETVATADGTKAAQEAANEVVHGVHFTNIHRIKDMELSLEEILARIDSDRAEAAAGISVFEEEILIKVADTEAGLYSAIDLTKTEILSTVADTERELRAVLDIQSSAVTALVQGGGAQGKLALSLELPAMIDKATHKKFFEKCGEAETAAVYARLDGMDFHAIKGNAGGTAVKNLWNRAVKAGLLASQIQLNANQIVVQNGDKTAAAFIDGKLRAACIDAENLVVQQLKIDSDKNSDQDFEAYFDKIRGLQIKNRGADILKVDPKTGEAFFTGKVQAIDGIFKGEIQATKGILDNVQVNGFYESNDTPFQPIAMLNLGYNHGSIQLINNKNIASVSRINTGEYLVTLKKSVKLKTHLYEGKRYIDVFVIGNAADLFANGWMNPILVTINWLRNYVDGRLTVDVDGYAILNYFILYFADNSSDSMQDLISAQCFIFGTESN